MPGKAETERLTALRIPNPPFEAGSDVVRPGSTTAR
jgi:hypothetical protein